MDPERSDSKIKYVMEGWPEQTDDSLKQYFMKRTEITVQNGCLLWGNRVIIPPKGRIQLLNELHETHLGGARMKSLARMFIWWPKMDNEIDDLVKQCKPCQENRQNPPTAPLQPWAWPTRPWSRLHVDYAGPFMGHMFLIIVDAHSKWIEIHVMNSSTIVKLLLQTCVKRLQFGIPRMIVSDNESCFTREVFAYFCKQNGIKHVTSAPYHPSSNGSAERAVQTFKQGVKKLTRGSLEDRVARFLFKYRITPHSVTGVSPSELLMGRKLRSRFDLVHPDIQNRVLLKQQAQQQQHNKSTKPRNFWEGEKVYVRNFTTRGPKWLIRNIIKVTGPVSFKIKLGNDITVKRHQDQIRKCHANTPENSNLATEPEAAFDTMPLVQELGVESDTDDVYDEAAMSDETPSATIINERIQEEGPTGDSSTRKEYPSRNRKPPEYYGR
ncbi:hypothetical protein BSL78_07267 [Apostichopus japonicus]|uniref:Integrase catalytic domain-containing protein n=1 Tax=Stichopus japonicus TaxID=307972 RepID=A0A2G8L6G8_STIJA|nr:hypothetical protein BSL78_07267 [Apostichopus japonicus]